MVNRSTQRGLIMNRIFKFRAWEESENKMYKCIVGNTDTNDDEFICPLIWIEEKKDWIHSNTCVVMQYTGYKDIKGQEIYEGDILAYQNYRWIRIRYYNGGFMAKVIQNTGHSNRMIKGYIGNFNISKWEIIGNIYENKELFLNI